uniref:Pheromone binding protein 3 n=1 Tax=Maruca vitrata TaxID=497515 RepID=A0A1D6YJA8_MARVT|nr:pheromone-binding protein 2 [Maruca vitrata]QDA95452.1 pheromone binding protein 3 [Maruca vitrata]QDA95453.1 pheromone binding protein 3 [Maruca vitrata]QDA95455.1 pheromone binding protein 3 [Maruca vitrata]QDA95456.1 pheromone binding protein 3 [Maruca vitrata]
MVEIVKWRLATILVFCLLANGKASQEVMTKMSATFFKLLEECKKEASVTDDLIQGLVKFWNEDSELGARELGCVIICMATKHDLVDADEFRMHHENAYNFAKDHGADDEMAKSVVKSIHGCEEQFVGNPDHCARVMDVTRCFRGEMHRLKWAPPVEVLMGEMLAEV